MSDAPPTRRVVVLHGYNAHPGKHWFDWLAAELEPDGIAVFTPALPDSANPSLVAWLAAAHDAIGTPDAALVVIGHSLGSITAVKSLAALPADDAGGWQLGGLVLVSGFDSSLPNLPDLDGFTAETVDYAPIIRNTRSRRMIVSDDDEVVAPALSHRLAAALHAEVTVVPGGGHFRSDDGYTSFAEVARDVRAMLA
ncbi:MAG: serine hydrolase [Subtercola sp.]|nr:serine hydrolase [Subtercola sp.]